MSNAFVFVIFAIFAICFVICVTTMLVAALLDHFHNIKARRSIDKSVVDTVLDSSGHGAAGSLLNPR